jgi:sRNA-binding protein
MHFSQRIAAEMRTFWRVFTTSGSASLTAALGGLFIGGILFLEPVFSSAWERHNDGKLFKHIEEDVVERKRAQLVALQAARVAREEKQQEKSRAAAVAEQAARKETNKESDIQPTIESNSSRDNNRMNTLVDSIQNSDGTPELAEVPPSLPPTLTTSPQTAAAKFS